MPNIENDVEALALTKCEGDPFLNRKTTALRYETEDMHQLRILLLHKNVPDNVIDNFKRCLNVLTREGFRLIGPNHRA